MVTVVLAFMAGGCGGGGDLECGGPFCVVPPGAQQAARVVASGGDDQTGAPGKALRDSVAVTVSDDDGRPVPGVSVGFTPDAGTVEVGTVKTDYQGRAATAWTLGEEPGAQTLRAEATVESGAELAGSPVVFSAQAVRAAASRLALRQTPSTTARSGAPLERQPIVVATDPDGSPVAGISVSVSIASGGGDLDGTTTATTDSLGAASFSDLRITGSEGDRILRFTVADPALEVASGNVRVLAGSLAGITRNGPESYTGVVGSPVSPAPSVLARDASGNPVSGVLVSFTTGNGTSVSPASVPTDSLGIARVNSWTLGSSAGARYTLTARVQSGGDAVTFTATAAAGAAGRLALAVQPPPTTRSGDRLDRQPTVQIVDRLGNPASVGGVRVTASLASGPDASLENEMATTNAAGVATFAGLTLTGLVGEYVLAFSAPDLAGVSSDRFSLAAGPARRITLVDPLAPTARSRTALPVQPSLQLMDEAGNAVGLAGVTVRAALGSGEGTVSGTNAVLTDASGRATFSDLAITGAPGSRTLRFTSDEPTSDVVSGEITLPSVAHVAVASGPPASAVVGAALTGPAAWTLTDADWLPVTDAPAQVTASEGGAVEPSGVTSDEDGTARLATWTLSTIAGQQSVRLQVAGAGESTLETTAVPDAAATIDKVSGDGQSAPVNSDLAEPLVVRVTDRFGNGVGGVTVQWRTCDGAGDYDASTDDRGFASAFQSTGSEAGSFCVQAVGDGLSGSPVQFTITAIAAGGAETPTVRRSRAPHP